MLEYWIWLSTIKGVGPVLQKRLLDYFQSPKAVYEAGLDDLCCVDGVGLSTAKAVKKHTLNSIEAIVKRMEEKKIQIVTYDNEHYAPVFACKRSPILFYYLGTLPKNLGIAVVGARRCTPDAKKAAEEIAYHAAKCGVPVVSGMAKGIDSYAHTASLKESGYTMAIKACGVDVCYPKEHTKLYEKIIESGAVLSAYPPGTRPHPKYFVERNAYISAWSNSVVVVQAAVGSGSLTTATLAKEQGRNLFAVPYSIFLKEAKGSNHLLAIGAIPYLEPASLGLVLPEKETTPQTSLKTCDPIEKQILSYLGKSTTATSLEELAFHLKISETALRESLLLMEMNGSIVWKGSGAIILTNHK